MSVAREAAVKASLGAAIQRRYEMRVAQIHERIAVVNYITHALADGWSWNRIGEKLDISGTAARRYYNRNKGTK